MSTKKSAWQECLLKDVITVKKGKKPKDLYSEYQSGLMPYIDIKCFEKNIIDNYGYSDKMVIYDSNENHILLVWDGARSGLVGEFEGVGIVCSTTALIITSINKNFLKYYLNSKYTFLNKNTKGTGIPHINPDKLLNLKILVPPLEEQKLIVEKIESEFQKIDNALNKLNIIKEQIKQYKQSVLKYAFDENNSFAKGSNYEPYEWEEKILYDITLKINDGTHKTPTYIKNGIPFISVKDIYDKEIHFDNCKYISEEEHNILYKRCNPEKGDVLITKSGTIGRTAVINIDTIFSLFVSVALLKPNTNIINSYYLMYSLDNYILNIDIKQNVKGGVIKNLHIEDLKMIKIKLPNIELQKTIADNIQNIFDKVDNIENNINENIDKLNVLKQAVLKKAFEGKLI